MRGINKNEYNSKVLKNNCGHIVCSECGKITGYIYQGGFEYIKYMFVCNCKNVGSAELYRNRRPLLTLPKRQLYQKDDIHICQNCERPLFWVKRDAVINYSFNAVCRCGVEYDMKFINKRGNK